MRRRVSQAIFRRVFGKSSACAMTRLAGWESLPDKLHRVLRWDSPSLGACRVLVCGDFLSLDLWSLGDPDSDIELLVDCFSASGNELPATQVLPSLTGKELIDSILDRMVYTVTFS
jgi:hypothetical protein